MDLIKIGHFYINHVLKVSKQITDSASKMSVISGSNINVLLLDEITTSIISIVSSQSELLNNNIFLIEKLTNDNRDKLRHLNCIVLIDPNSYESIEKLCEEIKNPKYKSYNVFFTNFVTKSNLEKIAASDDLELIKHIEEVFWDYLIVNYNLFQLSLNNTNTNNTNKLTSLLLSLKMKPIIRFENNSKEALKLANDVFYELTNSNSNSFNLFNGFPKMDHKPLLLIVDRKNDPLTPLLTPWTYQSMIHEFLTIDKNMVELSKFFSDDEENDEELAKITLNVENDSFYKDSLYLNLADLSEKISSLVQTYKEKTNSSNSLNSIDDLKNFLQEFPEFKKLSHNVNKHIKITEHVEKTIKRNNLWEVGRTEQDLSVGKETGFGNHNEDLLNIKKLIVNNQLNNDNGNNKKASFEIAENYKLKLVMIYALRYEKYSGNQLSQLTSLLASQGVPQEKIDLVGFLLKLSGSKKRLYNGNNDDHDLSIFSQTKDSNNLIENLKKLSVNNQMGGNTYENFDIDENETSVYMQHKPRILSVLQSVFMKRLDGSSYPILNPYTANTGSNISGLNLFDKNTNSISHEIFRDVVIYFVGGVTFEEARLAATLNEKFSKRGVRIVIGSDEILNTNKYLDKLMSLQEANSQVNNGKGLLGKDETEERLLNALNDNKVNDNSFFGDNLL